MMAALEVADNGTLEAGSLGQLVEAGRAEAGRGPTEHEHQHVLIAVTAAGQKAEPALKPDDVGLRFKIAGELVI